MATKRNTKGKKKRSHYKKDYLFRRKKYCKFCDSGIAFIDYKNVRLLQGYLKERAKIVPRRISGTCARHQRQLTTAIKRARHLALVPFTQD
ncbi:MAG: 30S ribosomal protein S18 [Acidobacteriota bacterium]|jgi:small subunit ribosomal protein S18